MPYYFIFICFAVASAFFMMLIRKRDIGYSSPHGIALIATTWFSFLSPLSWYVIFKSLAYFHTHMNYLPWHMPFTLFGFGLCGYVIQTTFNQFTNRHG